MLLFHCLTLNDAIGTVDGVEEDSDDKIEMLDDPPKRPAASEVRQSIDALLTYSMFVTLWMKEKSLKRRFVTLPLSYHC